MQQPSSSSTLDHAHEEELAQLSTQLISAGFLRQPLPSNTFNAAGSLDGQKLLLKAIWSMFASRSVSQQKNKKKTSLLLANIWLFQ